MDGTEIDRMELNMQLTNAYAEGFNDGASQLWGDIDQVLKEIACSHHAGYLIGSGLLGKLRVIADRYKVHNRDDQKMP